MKRSLLFAACALTACTIVPDDAFQKLPTATLNKITITSNPEFGLGASLPSETLTGTVVTTPTKTTITWAGELDPFYFVFPVAQFEYTFSTEKLLTGLTITSPTGYTITENFTYNTEGNLLTATKAYENYVYTHTFYYKNNVLDSIGKTIVNSGQTAVGFFKSLETGTTGLFHYISVFPYNNQYTYNDYPVSNCTVASQQNVNYYNTTDYFFSNVVSLDPLNGAQFEISSPFLSSDDNYYPNGVSSRYYNAKSPLINTIVEADLTTQTSCSGNPKVGLSPYLLLPERNENYTLLTMLNASEELYWLAAEPNRIGNYLELKLIYEHTFAK